ncbi:MAG: PLxRFG domain-containing protein [Candidatus Competibacteraceae bacterium]|nr:PLxRFG domain-containing protein [Candidatus Competibacteraceae bacterium]
MPFTRGEWAETTQSFPYTAATMGPALVGGAVGSAIGGALGGLGGPAAPATVPAGVTAGRAIGGTLGGMLGAYLPAGGAATNQFIRDSLDKYRQDFSAKSGREPSPEEIDTHYKTVVEPQAFRVYHGEAAPEAAGTVAELGLMKSAIGDVLNSGGSLPMRLAKAGGKVALSAFGIEPATETLTQQIQQPAYSATGLTDEAPRSLTSPEDWLKSAGEVYKQAAATSLFFSALGIPAGAMYGKYQQRREGNARVEDATQATADLRANLEFAREDDITTALTGFDQIETSGKLPKSAAKRLDAARQQLIDELSLRAAPDALNEPLDTRRGQAGYLGFADRANELNDDQVFEAAQRPLPQDAPTELQDAHARYGQEAKRRQDLNLAAAHFEQNPEAVDGVAKLLADIGDGKPLNKGGHGSVDYNLSSLSDDMLARYRMAGTVLLRDHAEALGNRAEKLNRTLSLLSEETERRASGQRRDPQAVREADIAQRIANGAKNAKKLLAGLSPDAMERMASGLESRAQLEPGLASTAREIRALASKERARLFNPQGAKQPGIQSALRGWNQNQPAPQGQPLDQQIAADRARLSELAQQQVERQRQETLADRTQAIQQQEADRRARLNAEIATRGAPGELARLLGPDTQLPSPRQSAPAPQSLSDLLNRPSQSAAVPIARAGERGSLSDLFPQNRNWWDTELSPSKVTTETPAPPKSGWARFGNETGTLNIPRAEMPQVKAEHRGALVNFLNARGVAHEQDEEVDPTTLKPTQAEFSPKKVQQANEYQGGNRSILVSSDGHVVDGHHQWLSALSKGTPIKAIRLDAPIADLLPLVKEFPSSTESKATTQPQPEQRREERQAEAAPLLSQEAGQKSNAKKPKAKGVAPTWNSASEIERAAMISRSSEKAGAPVSNTFAQRKAAEWKTWADIPDGPAKQRLRDYMKSVEQISIPATMDGGKAAPEKTKNPYATSKERDEAISRLENAARNSEYRAIRENADLIGDAARMGATEAEMMAAIEAGDGKALERIADRQHEKTGGLLLGFGNGKLSQSFGYKKVERHPAHDYKNWENLTDAQVNAFSKAASIKPGKTRQETLDRIDSRKTPAEWAEAWDKAFPENRNRLTDIGKAETAPNRTEYQGKDTDKKADIKSSKQSPPPASQGAARNRAINATVDAGKDSILTAIAKIGGLDRAEAQRQGIDPAEFQRMPVFGKPVFRKNSGKSFDAMAESLSEFGYPVLDEKRNYSPNVLLDAISRELAGNPVYTPQGIESAARRDAEEQAKFEQDNWLLDAVDLEHTGFDALNDQEQVTAQLQAEASRDLGEDAADTIFERISQQHEQATPDQFNEALRAAFNEARQRQSANSREQAGEPGSVQATDAILQDYSIEELRAEEERIAKAQSDQEAKDKAAQQKTAADRARSDFVLTGSNRPADVAMARGQTNLLGAMEGRPKTRQSKPSAAPTNTIQQARAQLVAALNERSVAALERSGKLILHRTDPTRTGAAGYVDPQGAIHLIPSNMDQDALSVALHEAMHLARDDRFSEGNRAHIRLAHAALKITGLKNFIGNPGFSTLTQQLHRLAAEGNKTAIEALDKARREAPGNVEDEALAYLVQYADENLPLVRRIIAAIRAALYRMGIKVKLTPADVRALALSALKARAKDAALVQTARTQESFSLPEFAPTEADKAEVERQIKAVKEVRDGQGRLLAPNGKPSNLNERQWKQVRTKFFNDWFGDWENDPKNASKVVDGNGEPLVMLHGSSENFDTFKKTKGWVSTIFGDEEVERTGFFFTDDLEFASSFGPTIDIYLNIRNPFDMRNGISEDMYQKAEEAGISGRWLLKSMDDWERFDEEDGRIFVENLQNAKYDGSAFIEDDGNGNNVNVFVAFSSGQIKSATRNAGTFSPRSNRIDYSQPTTETDAAEQDRLWQEFQAVRAQFQAKQASQSAFDRWFGKGVEGVNARNEKPLVLYHGTNNPEFNRWDESRSGQSSQHPTAGLGFFMTADKRSAARYGSRLLELHAKIDNPYYMTDADLVSIESTQDAARFRRKLQAQGYDAAVISAPGGAPYVVALRSNQVKLASNDNPTESEDFRYSMSRVANRFGLTDHEVVDAINSSVDQLTSRDELIRNNVTDVPAKFNRYKIGSAQIETFGGDIKNRYINFLREFDPNDLILSESEEGIKKHPTYQQYVKWAKDGIEPPYIFVAQTESGKLQATNRRRTLAAREAGRKIKGWYGPFNQETGNPLKYGDILDAVAENRYSRPGRRQPLDSPRLASKVLDDIGGVRSTLKPGERALAKANPRNFAQMLTDLKANTRPQWLGLLTRNMQLELAREVLPRPMVEQFENAAEAMDAAESKMIQREAFPLADRWQALIRKHREQADRLARSLYMATWTGTDPRQPMPTKKRAEWIRTKAAYDGLTDPEAKKLFSEVLGFYQGQTERLFKELQNRIDRHSLPAADKLAAKDMLRQEFERMKDDGPYVPLMRFGDLTVFAEARTAGEKPVFATFETVQDQRAFADWLKKEGYQPQLGVKTEEVAKRALPQGDFVGKLAGIIDKTTQGPEGQVLKDAMYQLFLRSLPEQAIRKHFIHRRFVPGYTADALRTFATFGRRSAKQIARLAHSDRMSDALEAMAKANREGQTQDPVSAGHLINELEKSFQWAMNPGTNALSSRLTHLGFLWHLGASPAHLLLNLSQQAQVTFPWLAGEMHGKIGSGSVAAALANANKDFIASNPFTSATSVARRPRSAVPTWKGNSTATWGGHSRRSKSRARPTRPRRTAYPGYPKKTRGSGQSPTYANSPRARRGSFMWPKSSTARRPPSPPTVWRVGPA